MRSCPFRSFLVRLGSGLLPMPFTLLPNVSSKTVATSAFDVVNKNNFHVVVGSLPALDFERRESAPRRRGKGSKGGKGGKAKGGRSRGGSSRTLSPLRKARRGATLSPTDSLASTSPPYFIGSPTGATRDVLRRKLLSYEAGLNDSRDNLQRMGHVRRLVAEERSVSSVASGGAAGGGHSEGRGEGGGASGEAAILGAALELCSAMTERLHGRIAGHGKSARAKAVRALGGRVPPALVTATGKKAGVTKAVTRRTRAKKKSKRASPATASPPPHREEDLLRAQMDPHMSQLCNDTERDENIEPGQSRGAKNKLPCQRSKLTTTPSPQYSTGIASVDRANSPGSATRPGPAIDDNEAAGRNPTKLWKTQFAMAEEEEEDDEDYGGEEEDDFFMPMIVQTLCLDVIEMRGAVMPWEMENMVSVFVTFRWANPDGQILGTTSGCSPTHTVWRHTESFCIPLTREDLVCMPQRLLHVSLSGRDREERLTHLRDMTVGGDQLWAVRREEEGRTDTL